jgi:hypothetical protein
MTMLNRVVRAAGRLCSRAIPPRVGFLPVSRRGLLLVFPAILLAGCGGGDSTKPPETPNSLQLRSIRVFTPRVLTHMPAEVVVSVRAPAGAVLWYSWSATRGTFPTGAGAASVAWMSPDDPGLDTLTVRVTDRHDSMTASVSVNVATVAPPSGVTVLAGGSIADLGWTPSPDEPLPAWAGYEVYSSTRSLENVPTDSLPAYRIAGPVTGNSFRASGLRSGRIYYYRVGALRAWAVQEEQREERSPLTPQLDMAPRPEWTQQLREVRNPAGGLAIDLSAGEARPLDPADASGVYARDLYFGTSDPLDGPGPAATPATPRLKSIALLANRDPGWARQHVFIKRLGSDWNVSTVSDNGWAEEVDLEQDAVYAVKTPEGNFAKLQVADLTGLVSPYRQLAVRWAYQTIPGYPHF